MRVTKTIKDYITKQVNDKLPFPTETEYDKLRKAVDEATAAANEKIMAYREQLEAEIREELHIPADWKDCFKRYDIEINSYNTEMHLENRKQLNEVKEKREAAIENIVVTLELGGSREELEKMLAEL